MKQMNSVTEAGEEFWQGTLNEFRDALANADACGFTTPDLEHEWSAEARALTAHAAGLARGFGVVGWVVDHNRVHLVVGL